jgi:hypothetical protein
VSNPQVLATLDAPADGPTNLGKVLFGTGASDNAALAQHPGWRSIVEVVQQDLRELYGNDPQYGVGLKYAHRSFDPAWLSAAENRFQLVGIVNRIDRRVFHPATCGELRLIYRLAHAGKLPMTLSVVFFLPRPAEGGCAAIVRRFQVTATAVALASSDGPLGPDQLRLTQLKSVEVNLQSARWPSTVRPDLGGHVEYLLRVFRRRPDGLYGPTALENTPDTDRLLANPEQRDGLRRWIAAQLEAIDAGTARLPDQFLATRAVSVTPHGLARRQNRPFARLLPEAELADLRLQGRKTIASPKALLRRLDGLTCMGCHQSRSIAGFHVLGDDLPSAPPSDALAVGVSPHFVAEQPRRAAYVEAVLGGRTPDEFRPSAERAGTGYGTHCGLGDPGFAAWECTADTRCAATDDSAVGICLPPTPSIGGPCVLGAVNFATDSIPATATAPCPSGGVCERVDVGFAGGMCAGPCTSLGPDATCGAIALLQPFNDCLAQGRPFATCAQLSRPAALRRCSLDQPCRDDYLCARMPAGDGACMPPYFVLQLRVDGHPRTR